MANAKIRMAAVPIPTASSPPEAQKALGVLNILSTAGEVGISALGLRAKETLLVAFGASNPISMRAEGQAGKRIASDGPQARLAESIRVAALCAGLSSLLLLGLASTTNSPQLGGMAFVLFLPFGAGVIVSSLISIAKAASAAHRLSRREERRARYGFAALAALAALGVPVLCTFLMQEQTSAFAYLVYLLFAPSGLVLAAQILLLGATTALRNKDKALPILGIAGLAGGGGSPILVLMWVLEPPPILGPVGLTLGIVAVLADLMIYSRLHVLV